MIKAISVALNRRAVEAGIELFGEDQKEKALCILAASAGVEAFAAFGLEAIPTPVEYLALNRRNFRAYQWGKKYFSNVKGVRSIGSSIGRDSKVVGWRGHLVLDVEGMLVDPTAGQFAAPSEGLLITESVVVPKHRRPKNNVDNYAIFKCEGGETALFYRQEPHNIGYKDIVDKEKDAISRVSQLAISDVQKYLAESAQVQAPKSSLEPDNPAIEIISVVNAGRGRQQAPITRAATRPLQRARRAKS